MAELSRHELVRRRRPLQHGVEVPRVVHRMVRESEHAESIAMQVRYGATVTSLIMPWAECGFPSFASGMKQRNT